MPAKRPHTSLNVVSGSGTQGGTNSTDDLLAEIQGGQQQRIAQVARSGEVQERVDVALQLAEQVGQLHTIGDPEKRNLAQVILSAQMKDLRESLPGEQKLLAELLKGLGDEFDNLGSEFSNFETLNASEQAIVDNAKGMETHAQASLLAAQSAWFFKQTKIAKALADIESSKLAVAQSIEQANNMRTRRILNADFSEIFKSFAKRVDETLQVLTKGVEDIAFQYDAAQTAKMTAFTHKKMAATSMEKLQIDVAQAIEAVKEFETVRDGLTVGTEDRTKVEQQISDKRRDVETLQGRLNQAIMIFQAKERATTQLEIDEQTLLGQLNVHKSLIASLKANSDAWKVTFDNRLASMKAMAQSEASEKLDKVGSAMAQQNAEFSAKALMASMRIVTEMGEKHPHLLGQLMNVQNIQGQGIESYMERMNKVLEETRKRGGASERHSYDDATPHGKDDAGNNSTN